MKSLVVVAAFVYLLHVSRCFASTGQVSFDSGNYVANWTYYPESDKISVHVEAVATDWVGFGFAENAPNSMMNYDVVVGGYSSGPTGYLNDYYTGGHSRPPLDAQQNYNLTDAKQEGGNTFLTFERKRDTGDDKDVLLKAGEGVFLIWAFHSSNEGNDSTAFPEHTKKGVSAQKHVIVPKVNATAVSMVTASVTATPSATKVPSHANFTVRGALVNALLFVMLSFLFIYL